MSYKEILELQKKNLSSERKWWPDFLYHFTDVHNAAHILSDNWIYSRRQAMDKDIMENDNASRAVINATNESNIGYGRLYFRPLTPTQYHNEGYKPDGIRNSVLDANCPVPIFLCLSANKTLNYPGTKFAEKGLAGNRHNISEGIEAFSQLDFAKIYHNSYFSQNERDDIIAYRQSEVIRENGFPVDILLKGVLCRTQAERETLLYLLRKFSYTLYEKYKERIFYNPSLRCFYNNGIFIKQVRIFGNDLVVDFNEPELRIKNKFFPNINVGVLIEVIYRDTDGNILTGAMGEKCLDYYTVRSCVFSLQCKSPYNSIEVRIRLDDRIMYENEIMVGNEMF